MQIRDLGVLGAVILIVAMLIIPLPHWLLSFLIIINITINVINILPSNFILFLHINKNHNLIHGHLLFLLLVSMNK